MRGHDRKLWLMRIQTENTDTAVMAELGVRLRQQRLQRNLTQRELASEAGISALTLSKIEMGNAGRLVSWIRVLRALDLFDGIDRLVSEPVPSPIDQLRRRGRERIRASSKMPKNQT